MHHSHGETVGRCDHVDFPVNAQGLVRNDHGKVRGARADVARAHAHGVCRRHARARVALARRYGDTGLEHAGRVEEQSPLLRQPTGVRSRGQYLRENGAKIHAGERIEFADHILVVIQLFAVDGEHAAGFAHPHDVFAGQFPMDISGKGRQGVDVLNMLLPVEDRLIEVRDAPALRDIESEELCQLFGGRSGDRVAPGAEFRQLLSAFVKGQIAVHHGRDADGSHGRQFNAEFCLYVVFQSRKAGADTGVYVFHGIGPYSVDKPVLPLVIAGRDGDMALIDQHRFDACAPQFKTENGFRKICHFSLQIRSLTKSSSSSFSGVVSFVI